MQENHPEKPQYFSIDIRFAQAGVDASIKPIGDSYRQSNLGTAQVVLKIKSCFTLLNTTGKVRPHEQTL